MEQDFGTVNAFDYGKNDHSYNVPQANFYSALPYDTPPRPVCKYFITKGFCWEGDDCRSRHTTHENLGQSTLPAHCVHCTDSLSRRDGGHRSGNLRESCEEGILPRRRLMQVPAPKSQGS